MSTNSLGFGAYYPVNSPIHQLDPRLKITATILLMTIIFTTTHIWMYLLIGASIGIVLYLGKITLICIKRLRFIWLLLMVMTGISMLVIPGRPLFPDVTTIPISYEGTIHGIKMTVRLVLVLTISSVLTLTTTPFLLTIAIESMLMPFKKIGIPISEIAMIIQLTLRFIPTFMQEREKIMKAQSARGHSIQSKKVTKQAKSMMVLVVPLLIAAFKRVDELANAMDARGYVVGKTRTSLKTMKLAQRDYLFAFCIGILLIIAIW